ncbi:MAG: hypothetical protein K2N18_02400, partial [Clostridia bacterium]|nr:hypothetical protein [Clostridia bacterium]
MKLKLKKFGIVAVLFAVLIAVAIWAAVPAPVSVVQAADGGGSLTCAVATGSYLNEDYLSVYKIPTSMLTYEANGGE